MKEFVEYLVKNLVDLPNEVKVEVFDGQDSTVIEVRVADTDVAKVVGRKGRTIKSLRTIAIVLGARFNRKIRLEIVN